MNRALRRLGWLLLIPDPREREEYRGVGWALFTIFMGVFATVLGLFVLFQGWSQPIFLLFFGPAWIMQSALYLLSTRLHRAALGLRLASTLAFLAAVVSLPLTYPRPLSVSSFPVWFAVALVLCAFCINYFSNRHRARRSQSAA